MKALGDHLHGLGLKFGIYSSPGPRCCGGRPGSYGHEQQDAATWASWGVDYLKYDGCSGNGLPDIAERWSLMRTCLDRTGRDIVYSTNKYRGPGTQLWRTTMDIRNNWRSLSEIGFKLQEGLGPLAGPGRYNDPDMLVVGNPGNPAVQRGPPLTPNEEVTHMTLWTMLAAPLILGCDLTKADDRLLALTCNDEVLDINQDPLVRQGSRLRADPPVGISDQGAEVWSRPLHDGTRAVAFFNRGTVPIRVAVDWGELGLSGPQPVRDCWQRKDLGEHAAGFGTQVEVHGAVLLRIGRPAP
jgi:alpha-galactosidase